MGSGEVEEIGALGRWGGERLSEREGGRLGQ